MKSKKGAVLFSIILVVFMVVILLYAWGLLASKYKKFDKNIGERQYQLINIYQKGEKALFYIDQSAKYSLQQAVYELGKNGGISEIETEENEAPFNDECGKFYGYTIWYDVDKNQQGSNVKIDCTDNEETKLGLKHIFNENLNQYIINYPYNIPTDNYNYEISGNLEMTGKAIYPVYFDILKEAAAKEKEINIPEGLKVEPKTTTPGIPTSSTYFGKLKVFNRPRNVVVDTVILHHTGDDAAGKTFNTLKKRGLSVHYIIDRDGIIYYIVDESKMAQHAESWNARSIGIEIVNTGRSNMKYTDEQYNSIKSLIKDIESRWPSIKVDNEHVIGHYQGSTTGKWDPSPNFEWSRIGLTHHITLADLGRKAPKDSGYA